MPASGSDAPPEGGDTRWPPRAEEAFQWFVKQSDRVRAAADVMPGMLWTGYEDEGVDYLSRKWEQFAGRPLDDLLGLRLFELIHPEDAPALTSRTLGEGPPGEPELMRFRMRRHDGAWRWMEARMMVRPEGDRRRVTGTTLDITERVEAERDLQRREQQLAATQRLIRAGTFTLSLKHGTADGVMFDSQLLEIYGLPVDQAGTPLPLDVVLAEIEPDDLPTVRQMLNAALEAKSSTPPRAEYRLRRRDGDDPDNERWMVALTHVRYSDDNEPIEVVGVVQDVSDQRREARARLALQKLEATATLAGGIAHDFGNLIGAILVTARAGAADAADDSDAADTFADIAQAAGRARELVDELMSFARPSPPRHEPLDLPELAREAVRLVRPSCGDEVSLDVRSDGPLPPVQGDAGQLHQVLVNLLTNARQAIGDARGSITVMLDAYERDGQQWVRIRVRDDGPGMSQDVAQRVFDPFFSTRVGSGGTGLGLAAVQAIIVAHHGLVEVISAPGEGATFKLLLPVGA